MLVVLEVMARLQGACAFALPAVSQPPALHICSALCTWAHMQLVLEVMAQLEGAYALLVKSRHYPGELVACKRGSPLILGLRMPTHNRWGRHIQRGFT